MKRFTNNKEPTPQEQALGKKHAVIQNDAILGHASAFCSMLDSNTNIELFTEYQQLHNAMRDNNYTTIDYLGYRFTIYKWDYLNIEIIE